MGMARRPPSQWQQLGLKPDRGVLGMLIALALITAFFELGGMRAAEVLRHVLLTPGLAIGPEPWQLVTSGFIHPSFGDLLMTAIMLIFFGNQIEQRFGAATFLKIYIGGGVAASVAAAVVGRLIAPGTPVLTSMATSTALLMAFGAGWRRQPVMAYGMAEMRASSLAWVFLGINMLVIVAQFRSLGMVGVIVMLAAGWFLVTSAGGKSGGGLRESLDRMKLWRLRRRYRVLDGGRSGRNDKTYLN
jgi:membrane associated rhomboid family serine protease